MLCREIIAVCSQIHTKHINTLRGQNVELLNVKLAVYTGCKRRNVPYFGRVFLMLNYIEKTQNNYIQC
jgi:hypothetical protein